MSDLIINMASSPPPPPPPPPGENNLVQMTFSNPPTRAQIEQLWTERWHTRPAWWAAKTTPFTLPEDAALLPVGMAWDPITRTITVSGTVPLFANWDLYDVEIDIFTGARINVVSNCRFMPRSILRSQRASRPTQRPCFNFGDNLTGSVGLFERCWFTYREDHTGIGGPSSFVQSNISDGVGFGGYEGMRFCSFEAYYTDALKPARAAFHEYCVFDCPWSVPPDAKPWNSAAVYQRNDVVWGGSNNRIRICLNNDTTSAPDFSGPRSATVNWRPEDPHHDTQQVVGYQDGQLMSYIGCFSNRNTFHARYPQRTTNGGARGIQNWIRNIPNNGNTLQNSGILLVEYNIITDEDELAYDNADAIVLPAVSASYGKTSNSKTIRNNWYQSRLTSSTGAHITVVGNVPGWDFPAPATLSSLSAAYSGGALSYGFTPSKGGWMRIVVNGSATPLTAMQIVNARSGDTGVLGIFEIDTPGGVAASGALTIALSSGTYYAHGLFQHGGGSDTLAAVQTITV